MSCGKNIPDERILFEEAQKLEASEDHAKACDLFETLINHYPKGNYRYKALFMFGYIQLEYLKNPQKALKSFDQLLKDYPNCDLISDTKVLRDAAVSGRDLMSVFQDSLKNR
jgi:TolA-binding protein